MTGQNGLALTRYLRLILGLLGLILYLSFPAAAQEPKITCDFPGGNIIVDSIDRDDVYLRQDLRDTEGWWFYWMFRIEQAQGRTLTFHFTNEAVVGPHGPAVSTDGGNNWHWLSETPDFEWRTFTYKFGPEENSVYFCFGIPYTERNWDQFTAGFPKDFSEEGFKIWSGELCKSNKGRSVEYLRLGTEKNDRPFGLLLTTRNHACEMTGSYAMEGILSEILSDSETGKWFRENVDVLAIPFVDKDGVEDGDQGKNRRPHDHNRDYILGVHPEVRALKEMGKEFATGRPLFCLDLHGPWFRSGINEIVYFPGMKNPYFADQLKKFSLILEKTQKANGGALPYQESFNLPFGKDWNIGNGSPELMKCSEWGETLAGSVFGCAIELPFSNASGIAVTAENLREIGRNMAVSIAEFLKNEAAQKTQTSEKRSFSGVYPHLAMMNDENECGIGALVPFGEKLWGLTYGPHSPFGSSDRLYEIDPQTLASKTRPESIGGTHASRMIHPESGLLFIGPYVIAPDGTVRTIPPDKMPGRLTGFARSLTEPAEKILAATMEEGFYKIDISDLSAVELWPDTNLTLDENRKTGQAPNRQMNWLPGAGSDILPGYHGKGFYSGQGRLIYANNGENSHEARTNPTIPSGSLGQWKGDGGWETVERNQFCEVTGPGGIYGNENPESDPVWSIGWDHHSLILMLLDNGRWQKFRLPKGSHAYDGAHGWNTEWPRIRSIAAANKPESAPENENLLMTMHGLFWDFPKNFTAGYIAGIRPKSAYLKVIPDFCRFEGFDDSGWIVFGGDDAAKSEFLNKRKFKGNLAAPGRSVSNLWFARSETINRLGPVYASGAVWENEPVQAGVRSDAFLFAGWPKRSLYLDRGDAESGRAFLEVADEEGNWTPLQTAEIVNGTAWIKWDASVPGEWIRIHLDKDAPKMTAVFQYLPDDQRECDEELFGSLAPLNAESLDGSLLWSDENGFMQGTGTSFTRNENGIYENSEEKAFLIDGRLVSTPLNAEKAEALRQKVPLSEVVPETEPDRVTITDDGGNIFWLPVSAAWSNLTDDTRENLLPYRCDREVTTERDLFHAAGTFYELPAENALGFWGIRPVCSHGFQIIDYASWRGMLILSGVEKKPENETNPHLLACGENGSFVWAGTIDDLWRMGKPSGKLAIWRGETVEAEKATAPCLVNGYDEKQIIIKAGGTDKPVSVRMEADFTGRGDFHRVKTWKIIPNQPLDETLPSEFGAFWIRLIPEETADLEAVLYLGGCAVDE